MVVGFGYQFEGFCLGFFVDDYWQYLCWEEWVVVDWDYVEGGWQGLVGQYQVGVGGLCVVDVFGINVLVVYEVFD